MSSIGITSANTALQNTDDNSEVTDEWGSQFDDMGMDSVLLEKMNEFLDSEYATDEKIMQVLNLLNVEGTDDDINSLDLGKLQPNTAEYDILMSSLVSLTAGDDINTPTEDDVVALSATDDDVVDLSAIGYEAISDSTTDDDVVNRMETGYAAKNR